MQNRQMLMIPTYQADTISWTGNKGAVEASTLTRGQLVVGSRIWSDSMDVGFHLHSPRTDKSLLFTLVDEEKQQDEVIGWSFKSYPDPKFEVFVFND